MKIYEAVELVQRIIETMKGGELVIPELPAYRLGDLAEAMDMDVDILGLPSHEKLHESMKTGESSNLVRRMTINELKSELAKLNDKRLETIAGSKVKNE